MTIRLSQQETDAIVSAYRSGSSLTELSKEFGPSTDWLRGLLRKHGVLRTRSEAAEPLWHRRRTTMPVMTAWQYNRLTVGALINLLDATA